jgi:hypothetical protein
MAMEAAAECRVSGGKKLASSRRAAGGGGWVRGGVALAVKRGTCLEGGGG